MNKSKLNPVLNNETLIEYSSNPSQQFPRNFPQKSIYNDNG